MAERKYTQEQARKEFQQVFIPECNDDGTYSQVENFSFSVLHDWKVRVCMFEKGEEETNVMKGNATSKLNVICANTSKKNGRKICVMYGVLVLFFTVGQQRSQTLPLLVNYTPCSSRMRQLSHSCSPLNTHQMVKCLEFVICS